MVEDEERRRMYILKRCTLNKVQTNRRRCGDDFLLNQGDPSYNERKSSKELVVSSSSSTSCGRTA